MIGDSCTLPMPLRTDVSRRTLDRVRSGHCGASVGCPLYPQKRTSELARIRFGAVAPASLAMFAAIRRASSCASHTFVDGLTCAPAHPRNKSASASAIAAWEMVGAGIEAGQLKATYTR